MTTWQNDFLQEIQRAEACRARSNEGQARVCARRAAGIAVREYLSRRGMTALPSSAYDLLKFLLELRDQPAEVLQSAGYLTLRVDERFKLPERVDLIQEARALRERLLPEEPTD